MCIKKVIQSNGNVDFNIDCSLPSNHDGSCKGLGFVFDDEGNILDKTEIEFNQEEVTFVNL